MSRELRVRVACQDKYEAQKLASVAYLREKGQTFLEGIIGVYGTEVVISLKDKSAHSVMMADSANAEVFVDFVQSVMEGKSQILGTSTLGSQVELVKSD